MRSILEKHFLAIQRVSSSACQSLVITLLVTNEQARILILTHCF